MKKFIKYSLYGLIYLFIVFILAIIFMNSAKAELVKPNNSLEPHQVVKIQLRGLKYNDEPKKNNGIEQTWEFAHPFNKRYTGPLPKFINMIKSENYIYTDSFIGIPNPCFGRSYNFFGIYLFKTSFNIHFVRPFLYLYSFGNVQANSIRR